MIGLKGMEISLDVPFDAYKVKSKTVSEVTAGTQTDSLTAGQGVLYVALEVAPTPIEQIQEMVTTFVEQFIPLLINLMMLMLIMSLLTSIIKKRERE